MSILRISFFIFFLTSCEQMFYGSYKIIDISLIEKKKFYKVKKGDNLYDISKKMSFSINDLIKINNISPPFKIHPNQIIYLPSKNYHIVKRNETLYSISRQYDVDRFELFKVNKLKSENKIVIGQKLIIPNLNKVINSDKIKIIKKNEIKKKKITKKINNEKIVFKWPIKGKIILGFGAIKPGLHNDGINILSRKGDKVFASNSGKVIYTGNEIPGYGNLVLIKHSNNWITAYAHLDNIYLKRGSQVQIGEKVGTIGTSGNVNIPQLHFEIRKGKKALNPEEYLS
ncbi:M23 family metallopeptidase [Rickettsiales bacterium]|nr:M23 family metallopeptidase [Rickettsiales bacterium]